MGNEPNTQWHPAFCSDIKLKFRDYDKYLEYIDEYNLGRKPLQIDLLVIKKRADIQIDNDLGRIFRTHNIIEYKSPDDSMNEDTFLIQVRSARPQPDAGRVAHDNLPYRI